MGKLPPRTLVAQIKELKGQNQALRVALAILGGKVRTKEDWWLEVPLPRGYIMIRRRGPGE